MTAARPLSAAVLAGGLGASAPALAEPMAHCADFGAGRFGVMTTTAWQEGPIRRFYLGAVTGRGAQAVFSKPDSFVVLHCPTGRHVEVRGFRPFSWADDSPAGDPDRAADADKHDAIERITEAAMAPGVRVTLADLAARYRAEGLSAAEKRNFGPTCLCD